VCFKDEFDQRQPKPGPAVFSCGRTIQLLEGFKYFIPSICGNTDPGVRHAYDHYAIMPLG
jgi:hypothetical protein